MAEKADYIVVRTAAGVAYATALLSEAALAQLLEHPETLLWRHLDRPVKLSHETVLVEGELPLAGGPELGGTGVSPESPESTGKMPVPPGAGRSAWPTSSFVPRAGGRRFAGVFAPAAPCGDGGLAAALDPRHCHAASAGGLRTPPRNAARRELSGDRMDPRREPALVRLAAGQASHRAAFAACLSLCRKRRPAVGKDARGRGRPSRP